MFHIPIGSSDLEELKEAYGYFMHSVSDVILQYADIFPALL
ncbi:hypothetical protein Brsp02_00454 [Brucella sp. NBRC 113783]